MGFFTHSTSESYFLLSDIRKLRNSKQWLLPGIPAAVAERTCFALSTDLGVPTKQCPPGSTCLMLRPHLDPGCSLQRSSQRLPSVPDTLNMAISFAPKLLHQKHNFLTHILQCIRPFSMRLLLSLLEAKSYTSSLNERNESVARIKDAHLYLKFKKYIFNYN